MGICLGKALKEAVGDKAGIYRYGFMLLPMDEALAEVALDFSGRPFLAWNVKFQQETIKTFQTSLVEEFWRAVAVESGLDLHVTVKAGNLIDNAIKFSKPDSVVTVVVAEKRDKVLVSVKDTGIGIPKDAIGKIWERFYKTDLSRGKDKRGTGLGLSITKQIIAAHNENIKVISTEGEGTEFVFSLQRADS